MPNTWNALKQTLVDWVSVRSQIPKEASITCGSNRLTVPAPTLQADPQRELHAWSLFDRADQATSPAQIPLELAAPSLHTSQTAYLLQPSPISRAQPHREVLQPDQALPAYRHSLRQTCGQLPGVRAAGFNPPMAPRFMSSRPSRIEAPVAVSTTPGLEHARHSHSGRIPRSRRRRANSAALIREAVEQHAPPGSVPSERSMQSRPSRRKRRC